MGLFDVNIIENSLGLGSIFLLKEQQGYLVTCHILCYTVCHRKWFLGNTWISERERERGEREVERINDWNFSATCTISEC